MIFSSNRVRIVVATKPVDFRRQHDGLVAYVKQAAVERDRTAREIGGRLLAAYGWKIEREKAIFGHGGRGALVVSGEMRLVTNF